MWRVRFTVHPLLATLLASGFAMLAVRSSIDRVVEIGGGRTAQVWYLAATFAVGAVSLALTSWSSWRLLAAAIRRQAVRGNRPAPKLRPSGPTALGVLLLGPAVALVDVSQVGSWTPLGLAVFAAVLVVIPCGLMLAWQWWRIRSTSL